MSDVCVRLCTGYFVLRCSCMTKVIISSPEIVIMVKKKMPNWSRHFSERRFHLRREMWCDCFFEFWLRFAFVKQNERRVLGSVDITREKLLSHRFRKALISKFFRPHEIEKPAISNSSGLKSIFEKLCFWSGLVWTEGLIAERKKVFSKSSSIVWTLQT